MAGRERHEARAPVYLSGDVLKLDAPQLGGVYATDLNAAPFERHPGVDIGRVILEIDQRVVTGFESEARGNHAQGQRGRADERDLFRLGSEKLAGKVADTLEKPGRKSRFLIVDRSGGNVGSHRRFDPPRQGAHSRVSEKNLL